MGFLKNIIIYILSITFITFAGCTKPLILKNIIADKPGNFMYGTTEERNFYVPELLSDSLELNWIAETEGGFGNNSVVIYDTLIVVGDLAGVLYAFGGSLGNLIGKEKFKGSISVAPVLTSFRVFFILNDFDEPYSTLKFYDYIQGKVLVENEIPGNCNNELVLLDDGILVLTERGKLIKFNLVAFKQWEIDTDELTICSPAVGNNTAVFGNLKGEIIGIDISNRKIKYREKISSGFKAGISISDGYGYIADLNGIVYKIDISNGNVEWKYNSGTRISSIPAADRKAVYCGNLKGQVFSLSKKDGTLNWIVETDGIINSPPLVFENMLIQPDVNKKVHFISVDNGKIEKVMNFDRRVKMSPVYYNNTLYFGTDNNQIHSYKVIERD